METTFDKLRIILNNSQFIVPSYAIYGGMKGFHDYGILGIQVKNKLIDLWKDFFLFEEEILEIETPIVVPYDVLKSSGHIDRFADFIVFDGEGNCYRADHLLKNYFEENGMEQIIPKVDNWTPNQMTREINKYKIIEGPISKEYPDRKILVEVKTKNLMYNIDGDYLRPELAQGIFVNFKNIQSFQKKDLPFGIAQIGKVFRKEISPAQFIRMREFTQAEIEYFIDPNNTKFEKINKYLDYQLPLLTRFNQEKNIQEIEIIKVGDALSKNILCNETFAYFLVRIHMFTKIIGLDSKKIRFRQQLKHEMAHYANQCFDLEAFVNNNWLECIGCADRGSYDLKNHSKNIKLTMRKKLDNKDQKKIKKILKANLNTNIIGQKYKELTPKIIEHYNSLSQDKLLDIKNKILKDNNVMYIYIDSILCIIDNNMLTIDEEISRDEYQEFYPSVIEPSFGIDRLFYTIFEHNIWMRKDDEQRMVISLPETLTPYDVAVFSLHKKSELIVVVKEVINHLKQYKISCYKDCTNTSIGKKYSRLDEIGVNYAITIDPSSLEDNKVTIRDRDTMNQIRIPIKEVHNVLKDIKSYL